MLQCYKSAEKIEIKDLPIMFERYPSAEIFKSDMFSQKAEGFKKEPN